MDVNVIAGLLFLAGIFAFGTVAAAGAWATYWAVMRGFNQVIAGLQSLDAKLGQIARR